MKTLFLRVLAGFLGFVLLAPSLHAQAVYAAERKSDLEAGAGVLYLNGDSVPRTIYGVRIWGTYNFSRLLGVDAEYNLGSIVTPNDTSENSFMVGPRATYRRKKAAVYGKFVFGIANINNPSGDNPGVTFDVRQNPYFIYGYGGGFEYLINRHIKLRPVDIELQKWGNYEPHTLSPVLITFGVAYVIR